MNMKKKFIIKKSNEIDAIIHNKKRYGNNFFVIYYKENKENHFRFAISIGKKYGNAVERNKIKRQIRSVFRNFKLFPNNDYVVVVKRSAKDLNFSQIEENLIKDINKITKEIINE